MRRFAPLIFGLGVLVLWWVVAESGAVESYFLPHPVKVWDTLYLGLTEGDLLRATGVTLTSAGLGCVIAALLGIPLGYAIAKSRVVSATIGPYLAASQAIPAVALAPLLVVWIGYGLPSITVLCVILVIFPVVISTALGIRELDPDIIAAARLDGAGTGPLVWHIELPLAAPSILAGLRTGFTLSITGAVVGEMVMGGDGLGAALARGQGSTANVAHLFAVIAILVVLAVGIYLLLTLIEHMADQRKGNS
ncbi:ABC transporter permease [Flaviflexus massiliensis]|uniref:ABC transporter permease n=1 Tax=Flaviflexus massiliensis TaxID=1522309 RepID=UPI000A40BAA8|nr:ABC transporter permease [Flaviflexus massiliensis]